MIAAHTSLPLRVAISLAIAGALVALAWALGVGRGGEKNDPVELVGNPDSPEWALRLDLVERQGHPRVDLRALPDSTLVRERLDQEKAELFFRPWIVQRRNKHVVFDARTGGFRLRSDMDQRIPWPEHPDGGFRWRTNSLGMVRATEPASAPPTLRVLLSGDSHMVGVCHYDEHAAAVAEAALAEELGGPVEVLDASAGGYCGYNYLGVLEKHLALEPDVFVVVWYGGNDFAGNLVHRHYYERRALPPGSTVYPERMEAALAASPTAVAQCFDQLVYLDHYAEQRALAATTAVELVQEIQRVCQANGVRFLLVYLPPATDVEWDIHAESFAAVRDALELDDEALGITGRLADTLVDAALEAHIEVLDLRELLLDGDEPWYWRSDLHLSLRGHAALGAALASRLE